MSAALASGQWQAAVGNCAEMSQGEIMAATLRAQSEATNWQIAVWATWRCDTQSVATLGLMANEGLCGKLSMKTLQLMPTKVVRILLLAVTVSVIISISSSMSHPQQAFV